MLRIFNHGKLKRYAGAVCDRLRPQRRKHHFPIQGKAGSKVDPHTQSREFTLEQRAGYILFGWGTFGTISDRALFFFRLRRHNAAEPRLCLQTRRRNRQELAQIILLIERRGTEKLAWKALLTGSPTHVLRFGYQHQPSGSTFDTIDIYLSFDFHGWNSDGLAKAFGEQFLKGVERNLSLTWYLCPKRETKQAAALFWMQSAFSDWFYEDLGRDRG